MDTASAPSAPAAAAPPKAPAVVRGPMDKHEMKFVPRHVMTDYRDRLYHGKPEYNHKGIQYRPPNPQKINRLHTIGITGRQPVPDYLLKELAEEYFRLEGRLPTACTYPGVGNRRWRGVSLKDAGQVLLELIAMDGEFEPFVHQADGSDRIGLGEGRA